MYPLFQYKRGVGMLSIVKANNLGMDARGKHSPGMANRIRAQRLTINPAEHF
jgi:hypothetical protein